MDERELGCKSCNVEGIWGVKKVLFFQCLLFCGGDAAVTVSLALFLDKW